MMNDYRWLLCLLTLLCGFVNAEQMLDSSSFYTNFSNTHFIDQYNKTFKPNELVGKVVLFNFVYTKCSNVCPTQTKDLVHVYSKLSKTYQDKIDFVTVSLDSQYDKPKVLKAYAKRMKADFKYWQFISGSYEDIKSLQEKLFLFGNPNNPAHPKVDLDKLKTDAKEEVLSNHMTILWVVDKKGQLLQRYSATPMDVKRIERELKEIADLK